MKRWLAPLIGLLVGGGFLYAIATNVDLLQVRNALEGADLRWIALAVLCVLGGYTVRTLRWWLMLRATTPRVRALACFRPFFGSFSLNNVIPLRLGDVVRAFGFTGVLGVDPWTVLGTLVTERLLDLLVLITLSLTMVTVVPGAVLPAGLQPVMQMVVILTLGAVLGLFVLNRPFRTLFASAAIRAVTARIGVLDAVRRRLLDVLVAIGTSAGLGLLPVLMLLSLIGWMFEGAVMILVMMALGLPADPAAALLGFGCGTLATMLPGPPGHFGTFHFFAIAGLTMAGIATVAATAAVVLTHFIIWATVTTTGAGLLLTGRPTGRLWSRRTVTEPTIPNAGGPEVRASCPPFATPS